MPILTQAIAGPFYAVYQDSNSTVPQSQYIGQIGAGGITETLHYEGEDIVADALGNSVVDSVYLGGQCFLDFDLLEPMWQNAMGLLHPWSFPLVQGDQEKSTFEGAMGVPGRFASERGGILALYPASVFSPAYTRDTYHNRYYGAVCLASGFDVRKFLAAKARIIPVRLRCFPYRLTASQDYVWYEKLTDAELTAKPFPARTVDFPYDLIPA